MPVQLKPELEERLQQLAERTCVSPDELVQEAVGRLLADEEDLEAAVQRGREDIAAGRLIEHDEVFARIDRLLRHR
jgi:predicted transcriptional regulator